MPHSDASGAGEAAQRLAGEIRRLRKEAGLSQPQLARRVGYTRQYVSLAERPQRNLPSAELIRALDNALGAHGALLLLREQAKQEQLRRRNVLVGNTARRKPAASLDDLAEGMRNGSDLGPGQHAVPGEAETAPADFLRSFSVAVEPVRRVGWAEVEHVRLLTRTLAASENLYGGRMAAELGATHLRWAGRLLDVRAEATVEKGVLEAVGNLAGVVGFAAFDAGDHQAADRCFRFSLRCAEQGGSWELRAAALADMARQAVYLGEWDKALSLVEYAQVRADRVSATAQAMVGVVRARVLALVGRGGEAVAEVDRADAHFARRETDPTPPWLVYYDAAEHAGSSARALTPVAVTTRHPGKAAERLSTAIRLHTDAYPRSRAFSTARLATLHMRVGDPREAVGLGHQALTAATALRSRRMDEELSTLVRACQQHQAIPEVADFAATATAAAQDA